MKDIDRRLHDAIRAGDESNGFNAELIEKLITQDGADVNSIDEKTATWITSGKCALTCAIESNNVPAVRILINYGVKMIAEVTNLSLTEKRKMPIEVAFSGDKTNRNVEIIRILLEKDVDANGENFLHKVAKKGYLQLMLKDAAKNGQIEFMQLLVEYGANINQIIGLAGVLNYLLSGEHLSKFLKYGTAKFNVAEISEKFHNDLRWMFDKLIYDGMVIGEQPIHVLTYPCDGTRCLFATELHAAVALNSVGILESIVMGFVPLKNKSLQDFFNQPMEMFDYELRQTRELTPLALAMRLNRPEMVFEIIQIYLQKKWDLKDVKEQVSQWAKEQAKEELIDGRMVANIYSDILDLFIEMPTEEESNRYRPGRYR